MGKPWVSNSGLKKCKPEPVAGCGVRPATIINQENQKCKPFFVSAENTHQKIISAVSERRTNMLLLAVAPSQAAIPRQAEVSQTPWSENGQRRFSFESRRSSDEMMSKPLYEAHGGTMGEFEKRGCAKKSRAPRFGPLKKALREGRRLERSCLPRRRALGSIFAGSVACGTICAMCAGHGLGHALSDAGAAVGMGLWGTKG